MEKKIEKIEETVSEEPERKEEKIIFCQFHIFR